MKRITYSRDAIRTLQRIPTNIATTIRAKIEQYAAEPSSLSNSVKALKGEQDYYRLRVGNWRVVFSEDGQVMFIVRVASRGSAYD